VHFSVQISSLISFDSVSMENIDFVLIDYFDVAAISMTNDNIREINVTSHQ
jgi:hypothetical protein